MNLHYDIWLSIPTLWLWVGSVLMASFLYCSRGSLCYLVLFLSYQKGELQQGRLGRSLQISHAQWGFLWEFYYSLIAICCNQAWFFLFCKVAALYPTLFKMSHTHVREIFLFPDVRIWSVYTSGRCSPFYLVLIWFCSAASLHTPKYFLC